MDTLPTDEQLESLFKIGCWHQPQQTKGNRVGADMVQARANFVKEVVARGRAVERPPVTHANGAKDVCVSLLHILIAFLLFVCVCFLSIAWRTQWHMQDNMMMHIIPTHMTSG